MKFVLLIAVLVLVLGGNAAYNPSPCTINPDNNAYKKFVLKQILQDQFDTSSKAAWRSYLQKYKLCDRPTQSFVDKGAEIFFVKICNGFGKHQAMNLCTSTSPVRLHDLNVNTNDCSITYLYSRDRYVTVACDKVNGHCLPVQFESKQDYGPVWTANQICRP